MKFLVITITALASVAAAQPYSTSSTAYEPTETNTDGYEPTETATDIYEPTETATDIYEPIETRPPTHSCTYPPKPCCTDSKVSRVVRGIRDPRVILDKMDGMDGRAMMGVMDGMGVPETMDGMVETAARDRMAIVAHPAQRVPKENRDIKVTLASPECKVLQVLQGHLASRVLLENRVRQGHKDRKARAVNGGKFV
ncbi:hypothetical protein O9K51_08613 [Purpureocillium lavendulum]|uniref:Hydrophobin n=1 Tax=Purpureocillium lavendulum TaxID=1247861 RepID=A0AB34FK24_9HYPO|nr:hypothetical protein O9K51_08613 [Purpureocillium lavendulum]